MGTCHRRSAERLWLIPMSICIRRGIVASNLGDFPGSQFIVNYGFFLVVLTLLACSETPPVPEGRELTGTIEPTKIVPAQGSPTKPHNAVPTEIPRRRPTAIPVEKLDRRSTPVSATTLEPTPVPMPADLARTPTFAAAPPTLVPASLSGLFKTPKYSPTFTPTPSAPPESTPTSNANGLPSAPTHIATSELLPEEISDPVSEAMLMIPQPTPESSRTLAPAALPSLMPTQKGDPTLGTTAVAINRAISTGAWHTCALRYDGMPVCWGLDDQGQASPPPGELLVSISSGDHHTCGLRQDGTVLCWGSNFDGQSEPPADVKLAAISAGGSHTCGLIPDGRPVCWGKRQPGPVNTTG